MHIVCHMAASVDGRLHPSRWSPFVEDCSVGGVYEEVANQYDYVGWMIGRVTMAEYSEDITESEPAKLRPAEAAPAQGIKVDPKGRKISVAFDFKGKLHYGQPVQETGEQIVTVVSDRVCDEYIEELRQSGVGVVAVPVNGNELVLAMEQLAKDYGDGVWMLEGGAIINAAFIQAGLVDEVSTVIYPAIDATKESPAIYEAAQEGASPPKNLACGLRSPRSFRAALFGLITRSYRRSEVIPQEFGRFCSLKRTLCRVGRGVRVQSKNH